LGPEDLKQGWRPNDNIDPRTRGTNPVGKCFVIGYCSVACDMALEVANTKSFACSGLLVKRRGYVNNLAYADAFSN